MILRKLLRTCFFGILIVFGPWSLFAQSGEASPGAKQLGEVDQLMGRVISLQYSIERCSAMKNKRLEDGLTLSLSSMSAICQGKFVVDRVAKEYVIDAPPEVMRKVIAYYDCQALAAGNATPCRALKSTSTKRFYTGTNSLFYRTPEERCERIYKIISFAKAVIANDPNAKKICQDRCVNEPDGQRTIAPGSVEYCGKVCSLLIENRAAPEQFCDKQAQLLQQETPEFRKEEISACKFGLANILYGRKYCPEAEFSKNSANFPLIDSCQATASFRKAFEAKDAGVCENPFCRVMMGEPAAACQSFLKDIRAGYCGDENLKSWLPESKFRTEISANRAGTKARWDIQGEQLDMTCAKFLKEAKNALDKAGQTLGRVLRGTPGLSSRDKKLDALNRKYLELVGRQVRKNKK